MYLLVPFIIYAFQPSTHQQQGQKRIGQWPNCSTMLGEYCFESEAKHEQQQVMVCLPLLLARLLDHIVVLLQQQKSRQCIYSFEKDISFLRPVSFGRYKLLTFPWLSVNILKIFLVSRLFLIIYLLVCIFIKSLFNSTYSNYISIRKLALLF